MTTNQFIKYSVIFNLHKLSTFWDLNTQIYIVKLPPINKRDLFSKILKDKNKMAKM